MKANAVQAFKAYELLASQPVTCANMAAGARAEIVISAVADANGKEIAISHFGDSVWDLSALCEQSNRLQSQSVIRWPSDAFPELVDDCKVALYAWFKRGLPGFNPPVAATLRQVAVNSAIPLLRWMATRGLRRFSELSPLQIGRYVGSVKGDGAKNGSSQYTKTRIIDLLWIFREELAFPVPSHPWDGESLHGTSVGRRPNRGQPLEGRTLIIPPSDQAKIFNYCESVLDGADAVFDRRDRGEISIGSPELIRIRDCALYVVSITTGMRNDEAVGIESGSCRTEVMNGVAHHWIATVEHKTGKGRVEYLAPQVALDALALMERYAKPHQELIAAEIGALSKAEASAGTSLRLAKARRDCKKTFLMQAASHEWGTKKRVSMTHPMSVQISEIGFLRIAEAAKSDWRLLPHQTRKTFARCFVESRMGCSSLVFLKWQFKHTSMSMTELYASNPRQDAAIFDDILAEMVEFKVDLIESWTGDQPLSGGAGRDMVKLRAIPIVDRQALLTQTAGQIHIRATGHGWCLAEERGCGGAGLYEATRCVGCKSGVIDKSFQDVWSSIHGQQIELLSIADAGPAVRQRAERDLKWASQVLRDLGAELPLAAERGCESRSEGDGP